MKTCLNEQADFVLALLIGSQVSRLLFDTSQPNLSGIQRRVCWLSYRSSIPHC